MKTLVVTMEHNSCIFVDSDLNHTFLEKGYVVIDFLDQMSVANLLSFWEENSPDSFEGIYSSVFFWNEKLNQQISRVSIGMMQGKLDELLVDWFLEGASYITKYPSDNIPSTFELHQDFNMIDERIVPSIGLWIPLIDTNKQNGGLCVLPGSHNFFAGTIRGANKPSFHTPISRELECVVEFLDIKAGQACFFFHSLFHGSLTNNSAVPRPILHAGLFPKNSVPLHYYEVQDSSGNKTIEILKINRLDYYKNITAFLANPKAIPHSVVGTLEKYTPTPTVKDVLTAYGLKPLSRQSMLSRFRILIDKVLS